MLKNFETMPVFLACGHTDMRKSINGLSALIQNSFNLDPFEKALWIYVYSCRNCEKNEIVIPIIKAKAPKALLPKSMVSATLLAYILNQKFVNAMPLYRQEQEFKRLGAHLSRQNLSNWVIKGSALLELILVQLKQELLWQEVLHADELCVAVHNSSYAQLYIM